MRTPIASAVIALLVVASPLTAQTTGQAPQGVPSIDGTVDAVWSTATASAIDLVVQDNVNDPPSATPPPGSDFTASWKALWDSANLYVLVEITDDVVNVDTARNQAWQDDGVEVFVDLNNSKLALDSSADYDDDDGQTRFVFGASTVGGTQNNGDSTFVTVDTGSGWLVEAQMPWTGFQQAGADPFSPAIGTVIGLAVHVNDDDQEVEDTGDASASLRSHIFGWSNEISLEDRAFLDPSTWNNLELTEGDLSGTGDWHSY